MSERSRARIEKSHRVVAKMVATIAFVHTMILGSMIVSMLIMAIGNNLARGLGILGTLAVIRFRTPIRDPRDMMFLFACLGIGILIAMAAIIGLDDDAINAICAKTASEGHGVVAAVNFNSPGQVVIAGHTGAVDAAIVALKEAGAKRALPLPVSAPFHTALMKPAGERLAEVMDAIEIASPVIPVIHNVNAETEDSPDRIRALMVEQIYSPVQWTGCVQAIVDRGVSEVVECGPGKVLSGLNRRIDKSLQSFSLEEPDSLAQTLTELTQ